MAAITATNFVETVEDRRIENKKKVNRVKLALSATEALTYPSSGGIPLPTSLGMVRNVDYVNIIEGVGSASNSGGIVWRYEVTNHAVRGYWGLYPTAAGGATHLSELPTTWHPSDTNTAGVQFYVEAKGW